VTPDRRAYGPSDLAAFEVRARTFLDSVAERRGHGRQQDEPDRIGLLPERPDPAEERRMVAAAKAWKAAEFDAGFGWITGPPELGGAGLGPEYAAAYRQLRTHYRIPDLSAFGIGLGMVAPAVEEFGTEAVRRRYLPALHRGDLVGCQLFSEPSAGSDLASLRTLAARTADGWRINGQKVWTTAAHLADVGLLLARTDTGASRHAGISAFLVDMHAPGVEVRPLRQATGAASFTEVFLTDAHVPADRLLGAENGGWTVTRATLGRERDTAGNSGADLASTVQALTDLVRRTGRSGEREVRIRWADCYARMLARRFTTERAAAERTPGAPPGPEMAMGKLTWTTTLQRCAALAGDLLGPALTADTGVPGTFAWADFVLTVPGIRISAGTDEIIRNTLAERVLGLPRDPSPRPESAGSQE
jgi:alkylation response protein AidB-like acyl-CoA dehydrogenase